MKNTDYVKLTIGCRPTSTGVDMQIQNNRGKDITDTLGNIIFLFIIEWSSILCSKAAAINDKPTMPYNVYTFNSNKTHCKVTYQGI